MCIFDSSVCCEDYFPDVLVDSHFLSCEYCEVYLSFHSDYSDYSGE